MPPAGTALGSTTWPHRRQHAGLDEVRYAHPDGSNIRDGLTWGTAKQTILAAYDSLPAAGGTIRVANNTTIGGEVADQGLWLIGPNDAGYASPPTGWRQQKRLRLVGIGDQTHTPNSPAAPGVAIIGGSGTDTAKPTIWISGTSVPLHFENLNISFPAVAVRIGVTSGGDRTVNTAGIRFVGCGAALNQISGNGPTVDIGYAFWVWFENCVLSANANAPGGLDVDARAAILIKAAATGPNPGLIYMRDINLNSGGVRYRPHDGATAGSIIMENCTVEGDGVNPVPSAFRWRDGAQSSLTGQIYLRNLGIADAPGSDACVIIDGKSVNPESVVCVNIQGRITGPATRIGGYPADLSTMTSSPANEGQIGFWANRVIAQHDSARRVFAPTAVRFTNLAPQDVNTWGAKPGTATVTTGRTAPDGTTNAAKLSSAAGTTSKELYAVSKNIAVGDFVISGIWVRKVTGPAVGGGGTALMAAGWGNATNHFDDSGSNNLYHYLPWKGDSGEWEWVYKVGKVTAAPTSPSNLLLYLFVENPNEYDFYAPVLLYLPVGTVSDNEARELAMHLASYPDTAAIGTISTLRGQKLIAWGGIGVGNSAAATTPGSVVKKMEVFSETGASLGFVPIYSSIT